MNLPAAILVIRWLVWDTFRQSMASGLFWLMLGISLLAVVFCLGTATVDLPLRPTDEVGERLPGSAVPKGGAKSADAAGVDIIDGKLTFLFGAITIPQQTHYRDDVVRWFQLILAAGVADTLGLLFALIWTAAFLPTFLEPGSVTVLLAKPIPRWSLLAGKYLGVIAFVAFQVSVFVVGTWLALALKTGVWSPHYLLCMPLVVIHFAIFFSFSVFLAVWTRSTIVCVFGSLLFWFMCWGMNFGRHASRVSVTDSPEMSAGYSGALELGYWILPKPFDMGYLLAQAVKAGKYFPIDAQLQAVQNSGALHLDASLITSLAFAVVMLAVAGYEFVKSDY